MIQGTVAFDVFAKVKNSCEPYKFIMVHKEIHWLSFRSPKVVSSFLTLNSICCMALCESAATELESKNAHGISPIFFGVFTDPFFDFFVLIFF